MKGKVKINRPGVHCKVAASVHIFRSVIKETRVSCSAKGCRNGQNYIESAVRKHRGQHLEWVVIQQCLVE